jgi:hypothetical protein
MTKLPASWSGATSTWCLAFHVLRTLISRPDRRPGSRPGSQRRGNSVVPRT